MCNRMAGRTLWELSARKSVSWFLYFEFKAVSALRSGLMWITANSDRSRSKPIESRPHWCSNAHTHGAALHAKHATKQKWRCCRVCFVHRQLPKFRIDIFIFVSCTLQSAMVQYTHRYYTLRYMVYICLTSTFTFVRVGDNNHVIDTYQAHC